MPENPIATFPIPQPIRGILGICFLASTLSFFVSLAIFNLLNGIGIIASVLWLLLVGLMLFGFCKQDGTKQVVVYIVGAFVRKQFAWAVINEIGQTEIRFGYQINNRRFYYLTVLIQKIQSVNWSTGQASHMSGRDVGDWSVALWYDHDIPEKSQKQSMLRKPDQDNYIVGLSGPKDTTAAFAHQFLGFLRQSGLTLIAGKDDCEYVRKSPSA